MTTTKTSTQAALPMGTTPAAAVDCAPVTVTFADDWAESIHEHASYLKSLGESSSPEHAARSLFNAGVAAYEWAREHLAMPTVGHVVADKVSAPVAAPVATTTPARTGDALVSEVARRIANHAVASGAGFWSGGVPEVRDELAVDADGQTIAAAFRRIERGQVAGVGATRCPQNHRAGGSYALWTVTVAPKKPAT